MKKSIIIILIAVICINVFAGDKKPQKFSYPSKVPATFDASRLSRVDSVLNRLVADGVIPHAVTFVAHKGKVVHHKAYGKQDIEKNIPCQTNNIFRMASQTKAITATAILTLFEEGKIMLDDPVKKYIPEFSNPQVLVDFNPADSSYTTRPAKRDITIRHLLTHTAGISYGNDKTRKIYDKAGVPLSPMMSDGDITLGEAVRRVAKCPLQHDPGEAFTYGMSTDVLGAVIEQVSEMPVGEYFRIKIFEPLGMKDTYFHLPENKQQRIVTLYEKPTPNATFKRNEKANGMYQSFAYAGAKKFCSTGAGLTGTIEDYAKLCQMLLNEGEFNGKRILGRKTVEMMRKNAVGDLRGEIGFGLAFDDYRAQFSHRSILSEGSLRWGGWFGTDYVIDPNEELIMLFYINVEPFNPGFDMKVLFHNLVYQALK